MKIQTKFADVQSIQVVDTDLVVNLRGGGKEVIKDGALRAMADPDFAVEFDDQSLSGDQLLRSSGKIEVDSASRLSASSANGDAAGAAGADAAASAGGAASGDTAATLTTSSASSLTPGGMTSGTLGFLQRWQPVAIAAGAVGSIGAAALSAGGSKGTPTTTVAAAAGGTASPADTDTQPPAPTPFAPRMDTSMAAMDGFTFREALTGERIAEIFAPQGMAIAVTLRVGTRTTTVIAMGAGDQPVPVIFPGSAFAEAGSATTAAIVAQLPTGERFASASIPIDMSLPAGGSSAVQLGTTTHVLTPTDLALSPDQLLDHAGGKIVIMNTENLTILRNGVAVSEFTLDDLFSGVLQVQYDQSIAERTLSGMGGTLSWRLEGGAGSAAAPIESRFDVATGTGGAIIWGDGSGSGGMGYKWSSSNPTGGNNGGGGDDLLVGTTGDDLIFGDGSGGGGGGGFYVGGAGGNGGGGNDRIFGGDGDDIIFGDGFNGSAGAGQTGGVGGYGGGGGGSGFKNGGAGGWGGNAGAGGGGEVGSGVNNGGSGNYVTDRDGNGDVGRAATGTVATTVGQARTEFLNGPSSGSNMFRQDMGSGEDVIHGGTGTDYIMAGKGNDTITGGRGNDIMYGAAGVGRGAGESNLFLWEHGDAGTGAIDVIRDFVAWNGTSGDKLDISKLLDNFNAATDDISQWVKTAVATTPGGQAWDSNRTGLLITIDIDGHGSGAATQQIFLSNVTDSTLDAAALVASGALIV